MFFTVPESSMVNSLDQPSSISSPNPSRVRSNPDTVAGYYPKRTPKACDRCRLKKARCSLGRGACTKCKRDGVVCVTSSPARSDARIKNPEYVQMVEGQRDILVKALHKIWNASRGNLPNSQQELNAILGEIAEDQSSNTDSINAAANAVLQGTSLNRGMNANTPPNSFGNQQFHPPPAPTNAFAPPDQSISALTLDIPTKPQMDPLRPDPQNENNSAHLGQLDFETWCGELFPDSLDPITSFAESIGPFSPPNMEQGQSPQVNWDDWSQMCEQNSSKVQ